MIANNFEILSILLKYFFHPGFSVFGAEEEI